jgi:hypothetical protein
MLFIVFMVLLSLPLRKISFLHSAHPVFARCWQVPHKEESVLAQLA